MCHLVLHDLSLGLNQFRLDKISLSIKKGEYHILLGPSGSGKSSLIKSILGFYNVESGYIWCDGREITKELPESRRIGYVPQSFALFSHMSVEENIRYGMRMTDMTNDEADKYFNRLVDVLGIRHLCSRKTDNLSGGEKQRVAIGRSLGMKPDTILLDEPFSAIDENNKRMLWYELKQIIDEFNVTVLHVTHNLEEAEILGDRLSLMINGKIIQTDDCMDFFKFPVNEAAARYLNYRNIFKGKVDSLNPKSIIIHDNFILKVAGDLPDKETVTVCINPLNIRIIDDDCHCDNTAAYTNQYSGLIVNFLQLLEYNLLWFRFAGSTNKYDLEIKCPGYADQYSNIYIGKKIRIGLREPDIICYS